MEDFYPVRSEDIPELRLLVDESLFEEDGWGMIVKGIGSPFLDRLIADLLDDAETRRALENFLFVEFWGKTGKSDVKVSDGFWKIVEAYLEENNGIGNLLQITEAKVLNEKDYRKIGNHVEKFLLRYSFPASSAGSGLSANSYSLSRDFLHAEKKDVAGNSGSVWNANSVEQALQNPVIMEKIFKKLQIKDQKLFRLVSPGWMEETFSFWRRNARILIYVSRKEHKHNSGIPLGSFLDLWEKNKKKSSEKANADVKGKQSWPEIEGIKNYKLHENPFHCYEVRYNGNSNLLSCRKTEEKFWQMCGDHIEDLKIIDPSYDFWLTQAGSKKSTTTAIKNCKRLLLDNCQNLKRLEISGGYKYQRIFSNSEKNKKKRTRNGQTKLGNAERTKIAKNLRILKVGDVDEEFFRSLLFICPNVKELTMEVKSDLLLGALLSPVANGEFVKLKKLVLRERINIFHDFISLRQYTEMLAKNKFDSFEHFELSTKLSYARSSPFNLYAALAQASKNLKTLELDLLLSDGDDKQKDSFMDLSPFKFPNLTKLSFFIDFKYANQYFRINPKFDFGTLKGMPLLEKLEIRTKHPAKKVLRKAGTKNWIFEGDRNKYLPIGIVVEYQYSDEDPILCSKLKEFTFVGWSLTKEDIELLSGWFPNLTHLEAELNHEALPILLENWQRLEKLVIRTEKLVSLRKLRPLKEKKKHLRILQRFLTGKMMDDKNHDNLLELEEKNGRLFFPV